MYNYHNSPDGVRFEYGDCSNVGRVQTFFSNLKIALIRVLEEVESKEGNKKVMNESESNRSK